MANQKSPFVVIKTTNDKFISKSYVQLGHDMETNELADAAIFESRDAASEFLKANDFNEEFAWPLTVVPDNRREFDILSTSAMPSGYGHYKISVNLMDEANRCKTFTATTTLLHLIDEAKRLIDDGEITVKEKNQRFFDIIESDIEGSLDEWLEEDIED